MIRSPRVGRGIAGPGKRASMRVFAGSGFELDVAEPSRMLYGERIG